jgi:hypothetical protein
MATSWQLPPTTHPTAALTTAQYHPLPLTIPPTAANPCGFVAFDVDPGQPGGDTSIAATYFAVNGPFGEVTPVDKFTLTRPRRG